MRSWDVLPAHPIESLGTHSRVLLERGLRDLRSFAAHLQRLPYGRNSDRADYSLVLAENRGTCSTKHALLAAVASEQSLALELVVGIYDMSEANTPGVGTALARHRLSSIPEAHCYLRYEGERIDITRSGVSAQSEIANFHREWVIEPDQIGEHKQELHREFLRGWLEAHVEEFPEAVRSFDVLWQVREQCIAALAQ